MLSAVQNNDLTASAPVDYEGRAVGGPVGECFPAFFAAISIKGDDACFGLAANAHNQQVAFDQRCHTGPILRNTRVVLLRQVLVPKDFPVIASRQTKWPWVPSV